MGLNYDTASLWNSWEKFAAASDEQVEAWRVQAIERDAANKLIYLERCKANQAIVAQIKELFGANSLQYKYMVKHPIQGFFENYTHGWETYNRQRKERIEKEAKEKLRTESQKKREAEKRKALLVAWEVSKRNNLPFDEETDPQEVLYELLKRDRYLELAHAMMETRNDWSDGFDRVQYALATFIKKSDKSEQDNDIIEDIADCLNGDHDDGRVFRDTRWNYDRIYKLVDPQLAEDYATLVQLRKFDY